PELEPLAAGFVPAGGKTEDPYEEAFDAAADGAGDGALAAHGGLQLALEPTLELLQVGERQRLQLEDGHVVVAPVARGPDRSPVGALDRRARGIERRVVAHLGGARLRPNQEAPLEGVVEEDPRRRLARLQVVEEAVAPQLDPGLEPERQPRADGLLEG